MEDIRILINEGEELKSTFTKKDFSSYVTTDVEGVSTWNTKCIRIVRREEGENSELYKLFVGWVGKISRLTSKDFDELVGVLKGIEKTPEQDTDWGELNS